MKMIRHAKTGTLLVLALLASAPVAEATPPTMTRDQIIALCKQATGYSYWWGHARWRTDGAQHGGCSGSCPSCTHSGSYGADCSGLAGKVWQVPSSSPVTTDSHPYSTVNFRNDTTYWSHISWGSAKKADAFVYNSNGEGHIFIYDSGDPWGQVWAYECKGCSYGCVHDLRSVSSVYIAIRRKYLQEAETTGKMEGAVFVDHGQGTADMSERIAGATVTASGHGSTTSSSTGLWSFTLPPGTYTFTASKTGFKTGSRSCAVTAGGDDWCSFGLVKECTPSCGGKQCGSDGCGGSCGSCGANHTCDASGQCACTPNCDGRSCGPDPVCGTSCGSCPSGQACNATGQCSACTPSCAGIECGPDPVCGTSCGSCPSGKVCSTSGRCEDANCKPDCQGRLCGRDPVCGESCGICSPEQACGSSGQCQPIDSAHGKLYGYTVVKPKDTAQTDLHDAERVGEATVTTEGGDSTEADKEGYFEILVVPGDHLLTAKAAGYNDGTADCSVQVGGHAECYVALSPKTADGEPDESTISGGCATLGGSSALGSLALLLAGLFFLRRRPV